MDALMNGWNTLLARRRFLKTGLSCGVALLAPQAAFAEHTCVPEGSGASCDAKIHTTEFVRVAAAQKKLFWCWAATLEMIFRWYGKDITQQSIVKQTFGSEVNAPANLMVLMNVLNRDFFDRLDGNFAVSSKVWSPDFSVSQIDNGTLIERLTQQQPLIVCNLSHMMVLVGLNYFRSANGMIGVREAWVADPMLQGSVTDHMGHKALRHGFRYLSPQELIPVYNGGALRFMADVQVT